MNITTFCLFVHPLMIELGLFYSFDYLCVMLQWALVYKYLFESLLLVLLGIQRGTKLLETVNLCLPFWGTAFHSAVVFYCATSNVRVWEFQFLHILTNTCHLKKCLFMLVFMLLLSCRSSLYILGIKPLFTPQFYFSLTLHVWYR